MIQSDRVRRLLDELGLSQSELARRVNVTQGAIAKIVSRNPSGSSHLHKIARELGTTPAYLTGEIDDPSPDAHVAPCAPQMRFVSVPIGLPSEDALAAAYRALLLASRRMDTDELARELAKRLPTILRIASKAVVSQPSGNDVDLPLNDQAPIDDRPLRQRA